MQNLLELIKRVKSISDTGLLYAGNEYEKERYEELQQISFELLQSVSENPIENLKCSFPTPTDYPTAKVDIRGMLLSPNKEILLVKESADEKWSLPGGWADIGYSPTETIIKEFKEESGMDVAAKNLLAVFDKRKHNHPAQPFYVYKMVFYCEALSLQISKGFDVLDVQYFNINHLPELSEDRILKSQIEMVYHKIINQNKETYFD